MALYRTILQYGNAMVKYGILKYAIICYDVQCDDAI